MEVIQRRSKMTQIQKFDVIWSDAAGAIGSGVWKMELRSADWGRRISLERVRRFVSNVVWELEVESSKRIFICTTADQNMIMAGGWWESFCIRVWMPFAIARVYTGSLEMNGSVPELAFEIVMFWVF